MRSGRLSRGTAACLAACVVALIGAGCGGGGEGAGAPPVPEDCLESWNAEAVSLQFGQHVYRTHGSARAQVYLAQPEGKAPNIKADETCAVVFSVPPNDYEYGDVGLVVTRFGWASMRELVDEAERRNEIQDAAGEAPNATLFPDGSLEAD